MDRTETVMVPDGAVGTITKSHNTDPLTGQQTTPMNFSGTLSKYHGDKQSMESNHIVTFQRESSETKANSFQCTLGCFFPHKA